MDASVEPSLYGGPTSRRVTVVDVQAAKQRGERWPMLTSYDQYSAEIFDQAGIPVLLVGDSAGNNVYGYSDTLAVTVEELLPLVRAVARSARRALVVADLPFGSYQVSASQALETSIRFMKEGGAQAVKLEGGARIGSHVEAVVSAGIPVMAHIGFTPQSVHAIGGYRVQGRDGDSGATLRREARELAEAGASMMVFEMVPATLATEVTAENPELMTIGIGAGGGTSGQVLVLHDMLGLGSGRKPRFVRNFMNEGGSIASAIGRYVAAVKDGSFPQAEVHTY